MSSESPILVSGPGRSGTTFMQWFLSSHPKIQIFGQPYISLAEWTAFIAKIDAANAEVASFNETHPIFSKYPEPHHAGGTTGTFERYLADLVCILCGAYGNRGKERWGLKAIWSCMRDDEQIAVKRLFPAAKWIVCLRDPFKTIESVRSTFVKDYPLERFFKMWSKAVEFSVSTGAPLFKIDDFVDASFAERKSALDAVLYYLGEEPTEETDQFIEKWPRVHRDVGDRIPWTLPLDEKCRRLESDHRFVCAMKLAGY